VRAEDAPGRKEGAVIAHRALLSGPPPVPS